jgi:hypothetical protein
MPKVKRKNIRSTFQGIVNSSKKWRESRRINPYGMGIANYCGPGTKLLGQKAKSGTDSICKTHDYSFEKIYRKLKDNKITKEQAKQEVRKADNTMLENLKKVKEKSIQNKLLNKFSYAGIKLKTILEDNSLLDNLKFISPGEISPEVDLEINKEIQAEQEEQEVVEENKLIN